MPDDYSASISTTGLVQVGGVITGSIEVTGDADWFRMVLVGGLTYRIDLKGADGGAGSLNDPVVAGVTTAAGSFISNTYADDGGSGYDASLLFTPAASGDYFVVARSFGNFGTGTYSLSVTQEQVQVQESSLSISQQSAPISEGQSGSQNFVFLVTRSGDLTSTASVQWLVSGAGSSPATADDFVGGSFPSGGLTFASGESQMAISVPIQGDVNFESNEAFAVTLMDAVGASITTNIAMGSIINDDVDNINRAPVSANGSGTVAEDITLRGQLPAATDSNGDAIAYSLVLPSSRGTVTLQTNGAFVYVPQTNLNGSDSFVFRVSDGRGASNDYTYNLVVTPVNDAPVFSSANVSVNAAEDTLFNGQVSATDIDSIGLNYVLGVAPINGGVTVQTNGSYRYLPNAQFNGSDSFSVTVSDGNGGSASQTVQINISPVNDAPVFAVATVNVNTLEDTPLSGQVSASDTDSASLIYSLGLAPTKGSVTLQANGSYLYVPQAQVSGSDSFGVNVSDGSGGTATQTVQVSISPVNDAPVFASATISVNAVEDTALNGQVTASDIDNISLTYSIGALPTKGSVTVQANGSYLYVPQGQVNGIDSFGIIVSDGNGGSAVQTVQINISPVNDAPVFSTTTISVNTFEDLALNGQVSATDIDSSSLSYSLGLAPTKGAVTVQANGSYLYVPLAQVSGSDSFSVNVSDGSGGTATQTVQVSISPVNDAPVFSAATVNLNTLEDTALNGQVSATDIDSTSLIYSLGLAPTKGEVTLQTNGSYHYVPHAQVSGSDSFGISVSDGSGGSATQTVHVTISPVNDAPVFSDATVSVNAVEDTVYIGQVVASDVDSLLLSYSLYQEPNLGSVAVYGDGVFRYTPHAQVNGNDSFSIIVSDGIGGTAAQTVQVSISAVNDAPVFAVAMIAANTTEDTVLNGQIIANDIDSANLIYSLSAPPTKGVVTVQNNGNYRYVPQAQANGSDSFSIVVNDGNGGVATQSVNLTISPVNDAPVFAVSTVSVNTAEDTVLNGQVSATDIDSANLMYSLAAAPTKGGVTVQDNGSYRYVPQAQVNGSDSFGIIVNDGNGGIATQTVQVTIAPVNDAPSLFSALPDLHVTVGSGIDTLLSPDTFRDIEDSVLSYRLLLADGSFRPVWLGFDPVTLRVTGAPGVNDVGLVSLRLVASDGSLEASDSFDLVVAQRPNTAPVAMNLSVRLDEDSQYNGQLPIASDAEGDVVSYEQVTDPAHGLLGVAPDGAFTYTPDPHFSGIDGFTFRVRDNQGGSTSHNVSLTVAAVNDAPQLLRPAPDVTVDRGQTLALALPSGQFVDIEGDVIDLQVTLANGQALPSSLRFDAAQSLLVARAGELVPGIWHLVTTATDRGNPSRSSQDEWVLTITQSLESRRLSGAVIDGYVACADLYIDRDGDGLADADERTGLQTDSQGHFDGLVFGNGQLIAVGGVNIDTGLPNSLSLIAPNTASVISPITTLVAQLQQSQNMSLSQAMQKVLQAFALPPTVDLLQFDPLSEQADPILSLQVHRSNVQLALTASTAVSSAALWQDLAEAVAMLGSNAHLDLSSEATLASLPSTKSWDSATLQATAQANEDLVLTSDLKAITAIQETRLLSILPDDKDVQAPRLSLASPVDNARDVPLTAPIVLQFDEAIRFGSGSIELRDAGGRLIESFDTLTSSKVTISDNTLILVPTAPLQAGVEHVLAMPSGSILDLSGNAYSGLADFRFTTTLPPDTIAPTVQLRALSENRVIDLVNSQNDTVTVELSFSEDVTGLTADDLSVTQGRITRVTGSGTHWAVDVAPQQGVASGQLVVVLNAGAVNDHAENVNGQASLTLSMDTLGPVAPRLIPYSELRWLDNPEVTLQTSAGQIVLELLPASAPDSVANYLAYVNNAFYDGTLFHRVIPDFVVQTGGFNSGLVYKSPSYSAIVLESDNGLSNLRGTVAMARTSSANSATSQFYVNLKDNTALDYVSSARPGYAVFAEVALGMDVIDAIALMPTHTVGSLADVPVNDIVLQTAQQTQSGSSITHQAVFWVSGLEIGATWSYSLDGGLHWTQASGGDGLVLNSGIYAANAIQIRQMDAAGNVSTQIARFGSILSVDAEAPRLVDITAARGSALLPSEALVLRFNELIEPGSGNILLRDGSGQVRATWGANSSPELIWSGKSLTVQPDFRLDYGMSYSLDFQEGSVLDLAGNVLASTNSESVQVVSIVARDGSSGDDLLISSLDSEDFNGGNGVDRVIYKGPLADYLITRTNGMVSVFDSLIERDGEDRLIQVEKLVFTDKTINLTVQAAAQSLSSNVVDRLLELYIAFFNRTPDSDGIEYWIHQMGAGSSLSQISDSFYAAGVTYSAITGYRSDMTESEFIGRVYKNVLGRDEVDQEGLNYWIRQLTEGHATKGTLVDAILSAAHDPVFSVPSNPYHWVQKLLDNKLELAKLIAIDWGISDNTPETSISQGMQIASAVTSDGTDVAIGLVGIPVDAIHI